MSKFKKIDKEFLLTDSTENCYGFRLLTSGYLMSEYKKNPIGYHLHKDRDNGVLVKWEDLRMDGDKVFGKPCINLSHPRGQRTVDEVESGFLNAASMGHFVVLEVSDKPEDYLPNQKGVTVSKWFNRECSLVDIPGNFNALTELYDKDDNPITLENLSALKPNTIIMEKIFLSPAELTLMNLSANVTQAQVNTALADLAAKAAKVDQLTNDLSAANTAKKTAEDKLAAAEKAANEAKINDLVASGVKDGKFTKEVGDSLKVDYATNPDGLQKLVAAMPKYTPITEQLKDDKGKDLEGQTWEQLDKAGKLENLKATNIDLFKTKYKDHFGKEYAESK